MAQNDVATLQEEFPHATSMFEMWELNGLAQTAVAQRTEELAKAVTTAGQNVAADRRRPQGGYNDRRPKRGGRRRRPQGGYDDRRPKRGCRRR